MNPTAPILCEAGAGKSLAGRLRAVLPVQGLLSLCDQAFVSAASFAASVIVGRLGSREDLGVYALALSVVLFLRGVQVELVGSPYTVYCHRRGEEDGRAYTGSTFVHHLCISLPAAVLVGGAAAVCGLLGGPAGLAAALAVVAGVLPFLLLREYLRQVSMAHLRLGALLRLDATASTVQLAVLLLLGWFGLLTVGTAFAGVGAACALACAVWFWTGRQPFRIVPGRVWSDWLRNWSFGRWSLAGFLIGSTTPYVVPWLLAGAHGESATGLFAACNSVVNLSGVYVTGITSLLTPRAVRAFARGGLPELRGVLRQTALLFAASLGGFCVVVVLTGDLASRLVYGARYEGTGAVLAVLAFTMLINSLGITAGNGLWAIERPGANFAADLCTLVVTLAVVCVLVGPMGVRGVALALLAGAGVGAVVRWLTLWRLARAIAAREGVA